MEQPPKRVVITTEEIEPSSGVYGDLKVMYSKKTGLATGHTTTVVERAKRIAWVREYAREERMTPNKVCRKLLNEAIDRRMRGSRLPEFGEE